ncbi:hypothetical protein I7I50_11603 [Histoplasma capsulatum G186AR]|uniref:Uncharacterized protein n=1 Tax=Ajellomyces capsulatus TaxID=5037 RepID=A0A8H7Z835_AJECA|nr:hypothetical protein I7I52_02840 [Histoplasma capsulatum]QSS70089.1 hypothetical protein I7I50_11603 [Histoplasma capsulatum G186AR]
MMIEKHGKGNGKWKRGKNIKKKEVIQVITDIWYNTCVDWEECGYIETKEKGLGQRIFGNCLK